jgi:hypothetical protein
MSSPMSSPEAFPEISRTPPGAVYQGLFENSGSEICLAWLPLRPGQHKQVFLLEFDLTS